MITWITGLPNSGKSTVADLLAAKVIERKGSRPVRIDGDEVRLAWESTDALNESERENLGHSYVGLAEYLSSQGFDVIVSAVALYSSIFSRLASLSAREKVLVVFLESDAESLELRDTREIYTKVKLEMLLQRAKKVVPADVFHVENFVKTSLNEIVNSIDAAAQALEEQFATSNKQTALIGSTFLQHSVLTNRQLHWERFYSRETQHNMGPSNFAKFVLTNCGQGKSTQMKAIDFGCGDGRDSAFLAQGFVTLGVDASYEAIRLSRKKHQARVKLGNLKFIQSDHRGVGRLIKDFDPSIFYMRFLLHAMPVDESDFLMNQLAEHLQKGATIAIECRSSRDLMRQKGVRISRNERVFGHYRRFIELDELALALTSRGFKITYCAEGQGFAKFHDEDPVVIRILAAKE